MADAADSKSATRKGVKVRLLSPAPIRPAHRFVFPENFGQICFPVGLNRFNMALASIPRAKNEDSCSVDLCSPLF
jgi:hypothetical protein